MGSGPGWRELRLRGELDGRWPAVLPGEVEPVGDLIGPMLRAVEGDPAFTCPRCGMTSHSADDVREGYCGNCHDWTGADG